MTYTTTLKALRKHKACIRGYNKLVCHINGMPYSERDSYMHCKHDKPISLAAILASNGIDDALWSLCAVEQTPEFLRDCRLFAVACAREVQHLMTDQRSIDALDVAERYAHGDATGEELFAAEDAAWTAAENAARIAARAAAWAAAWAAALAAARAAAWTAAAEDAARAAAWAAALEKQGELFKLYFCRDE